MKHEELIERLRSTDPEAADALESLHAHAEAMAGALIYLAEKQTVAEALARTESPWSGLALEDRLAAIATGKEAHDTAVITARQSLAAWAAYKESAK